MSVYFRSKKFMQILFSCILVLFYFVVCCSKVFNLLVYSSCCFNIKDVFNCILKLFCVLFSYEGAFFFRKGGGPEEFRGGSLPFCLLKKGGSA